MFSVFLHYFFYPLILYTAVFVFISKNTKGRYGKTDYLIKITFVIIIQIFISYSPEFIYNIPRYYFWQPFVLLLIFCLNIHISTKRYNDSVLDKNEKYLIYLSPILNIIIYSGYFVLCGLLEIYVLHKPRHFYLITLAVANFAPIISLYSKEYDINIKDTDIPVNYREIFIKNIKDMNIIEINKDCIYINNFRFSVRHYQNKHEIISFRDIDNENLLKKYFTEKGIHKLGFHYHNNYYELTGEEYDNMIADIKNMKNVVFTDYPFIVIKDVKIFIRNDGISRSVVFSKEEKEKLYNEIYLLKNISKNMENDKYVCYSEIKKEDIVRLIQKSLHERRYLQLGD